MIEPKKQGYKSSLTDAQKKVFAHTYAREKNGVMSLNKALEMTGKQYTYGTKAVMASNLLKDNNVITEVEKARNRLEMLATKAVTRVEQLLQSENEKIATSNAHFIIDQSIGKAKQVTEIKSTGIQLNIDLTSALQLTQDD